MNYTPKDENNNNIPDNLEEDLRVDVPEEKAEEDMRRTNSKGFVKRNIGKLRTLLAGENKAGTIGGRLKDIATRYGVLPKFDINASIPKTLRFRR